MGDANQDLFDASLRHQIGIRRFTAGEVNRALELLEKADRELVTQLRKRLRQLAGRPLDIRSERYKALIRDMRALRRELMLKYRSMVRSDLIQLATMEADFETRIIAGALPVQLETAVVSAATLRAAVLTKPFQAGANSARSLQEWFAALAIADQRGVTDAITMGLLQEESIDEIVRRVAGTRAAGFTDGALSVTRRNAATIVRTAVNHVSNAAREELWNANDDIIDALKWNATLDGRTSATCRGRDGHFVGVSEEGKKLKPQLKPQTARPPAHPNCRSVMIAIFSADGVAQQIGERPFVRDARTRRLREIDFRADARARIGDKQWSQLSRSQRNALIRNERTAWAEANIGSVPADVDYDTWLRRQPTAFQNEVLGIRKAQAFRKGLKLDKFIDRQGNELTLEELGKLEPDFFPDLSGT